jgi:hypothetical protein
MVFTALIVKSIGLIMQYGIGFRATNDFHGIERKPWAATAP